MQRNAMMSDYDRRAYEEDYGPDNEYLTGPHFPNAPQFPQPIHSDNPMPPRSHPDLIGTMAVGGTAGGIVGALGGPVTAGVGIPVGMGLAALQQYLRYGPQSQHARMTNAYNNEYPTMPNAMLRRR